jgi:NADH:ubiquinone oxidoreductase subunit 3 (subunit A)
MLFKFNEYNLVVIYFIISCTLAVIMFIIPYFLTSQELDEEKLSAYECGFEPFQDARIKFDIQFYIIAILFILFDLEIIFFLPWVIQAYELKIYGYIYLLIFILLMTLGFYYEWIKKALDWA